MRRLLLCLAIAMAGCAVPGLPPARAQVGEFGQQEHGKYLVTAGDCAACHTAPGGKMLAGGRAIETPFGVIYSPNITPDAQTGIGSWSDDQFYRAMHEGIAADGSHLYPAFPYPWYTHVTRQDVIDIRAYLRTVPSVKMRRRENKLPWPLDNRAAVAGWNELYFKAGTFQPDRSKSAEWNRGAYLVTGLGHCGACHSGKNMFGAVEESERFQGAVIQHWYAPNLTGDQRVGLGGWTAKEIVQYLKTGRTARAIAYGPMAEVVEISTSGMSDADLGAIATYLKALDAKGGGATPEAPGKQVADAGAAMYRDTCSACHAANGEGVSGLFPALKGSALVQSVNPTTVVRLILNGGNGAATAASPTGPGMPAFGWKLSDQQVAAVASYVRNAWGNRAAAVSTDQVADLRKAVKSVASAN